MKKQLSKLKLGDKFEFSNDLKLVHQRSHSSGSVKETLTSTYKVGTFDANVYKTKVCKNKAQYKKALQLPTICTLPSTYDKAICEVVKVNKSSIIVEFDSMLDLNDKPAGVLHRLNFKDNNQTINLI